MCGPDLRYSIVMATESYVQPVHQPYITLCQGHRLCSTYKYANAGGEKNNRASHARLFVQGGEESKCLLDRKRRFFSPRAGVDAQLQSKYAAICITTGNEVAAHTGCRLFVLGRVSFYTYALSISAPALMLSSPPLPTSPARHILSILIFDLTLPSPPKIHFRFVFFVLLLAGEYQAPDKISKLLKSGGDSFELVEIT